MSDRVLALDPDARGLRAAARYERSKELLQAEIMRFEECQPGTQATDAAKQAVASHPRRDSLEDAADMDLALAEDLWKQGEKLCGGLQTPGTHPTLTTRLLGACSRGFRDKNSSG